MANTLPTPTTNPHYRVMLYVALQTLARREAERVMDERNARLWAER